MAASIPSITDLRKELDYGGVGSDRPIQFNSTVRNYWKTFVTEDGTSACDLTEWNVPKTKDRLLELTDSFLEGEKYGMKFWPDDVNNEFKNKWSYTQDRPMYDALESLGAVANSLQNPRANDAALFQEYYTVQTKQ
jgi:hypothetical protein